MNRKAINQAQARRKVRTRAKIKGTADCPRLSIFRSHRFIQAQLIDDQKGVTLLTVSDRGLKGKKVEKALAAGESLAQAAVKKGIKKVVFDRGAYRYHGRVKAFAEGARKGGLKF